MNHYEVKYRVTVQTIQGDEFEVENKLVVEAPFGASAAEKTEDFLKKSYQYISAVRSGDSYLPLLSPSERTIKVEILAVESVEA